MNTIEAVEDKRKEDIAQEIADSIILGFTYELNGTIHMLREMTRHDGLFNDNSILGFENRCVND